MNSSLVEVLQKTDHLAASIKNALPSSSRLAQVLNSFEHPAFIKSSNGQLLLTNECYDSGFGNGQSVVGKNGKELLSDLAFRLSQESDRLILEGAQTVAFVHSFSLTNVTTLVNVVKYSLLGFDPPAFAILGVVALKPGAKTTLLVRNNYISLCRIWTTFQKLERFDQECAKLLVTKTNIGEIAADLNVSTRTIEKHRILILQQLDLENVMQLGHCLCRLQDHGYCDFGI